MAKFLTKFQPNIKSQYNISLTRKVIAQNSNKSRKHFKSCLTLSLTSTAVTICFNSQLTAIENSD